jgi:hypothetical protein
MAGPLVSFVYSRETVPHHDEITYLEIQRSNSHSINVDFQTGFGDTTRRQTACQIVRSGLAEPERARPVVQAAQPSIVKFSKQVSKDSPLSW